MTDEQSVHEQVAEAILAEVGDQMGELYGALPDLIHDHYEPYQQMGTDEKKAFVQAVAEVIGGEGYDWLRWHQWPA